MPARPRASAVLGASSPAGSEVSTLQPAAATVTTKEQAKVLFKRFVRVDMCARVAEGACRLNPEL